MESEKRQFTGMPVVKIGGPARYFGGKRRVKVSNINAIILAGGKNTRMEGKDKSFLEVEGRPFIEIIIDRLKDLVSKIIVVTGSPGKYSKFKVKLVSDEEAGKGPLMGIYSGLKASGAKYNFVVGCDMPFISSALIKYMLDKRGNCDVFLIKDGERLHTLFGVYSKGCIPDFRQALENDELRIASAFRRLNIRYLSKKQAGKYDPGLFSVVNINTPQELKRAKNKISKIKKI